jgi:hypothetical protein
MPMLHGCAFPGCNTLTLSTYCVEHELLIRAVKESERQHEQDAFAELTADPSAPLPIGEEAQEATPL